MCLRNRSRDVEPEPDAAGRSRTLIGLPATLERLEDRGELIPLDRESFIVDREHYRIVLAAGSQRDRGARRSVPPCCQIAALGFPERLLSAPFL